MSKTKSDKRQNISSDSDNEELTLKDDEFDLSMDEDERERFNQMSEKEREIEIFKRLEQREIMKTREQIKRKLEIAAGKKQSTSVKRKRLLSHETDESDNEFGKNGDKKSSDEEGELPAEDKDETSSDDDNIVNSKPSSSAEKRKQQPIAKTHSNTADLEDEDTAYHKPSELANKYNKKMAMADLLNKRRDKKQAEEKRKKENQKAALDLDEIFGKEDGKSSSSSSSPASSRSSSPVYGKSRSPSPIAQPIDKLDDLLKCQAIRRRLARIVNAPFFHKTVVGCFVRVQIGNHEGKPTYRIAQVVDVVETAKVYEVEPNTDIRTNKGLKLKICNSDAQRVIRLEFVSNSNFTETEYSFWLNRMKETVGNETPLPTIDFVKKKQKEMHDALNYKFTDSEINLMVREKQRFKRQPTNFAFQKSELLKQKASLFL
uniref:Plus3 domain-containing protein n=1 Tax=Meloidogyne hapla TaxID=6305 RepID=A0A1I8C387_MELHA